MSPIRQKRELPSEVAVTVPVTSGYAAALCAFEAAYLAVIWERSGRCVTAAAKLAGMDRNTFRRHAVAVGVLHADS